MFWNYIHFIIFLMSLNLYNSNPLIQWKKSLETKEALFSGHGGCGEWGGLFNVVREVSGLVWWGRVDVLILFRYIKKQPTTNILYFLWRMMREECYRNVVSQPMRRGPIERHTSRIGAVRSLFSNRMFRWLPVCACVFLISFIQRYENL